MTEKNKYRVLIAVAVLAFVYLLAVEVSARWEETFDLWSELQWKEAEYVHPEQLAVKKMNLTARKRRILAFVGRGGKQYDQSQAGVVEFLTASAKKSGVRIESVAPNESRMEKELKTIEFHLELSATYHRVGSFLSEIESGLTAVRIHSLELSADPVGGPGIKAIVQGTAHVVQGNTMP